MTFKEQLTGSREYKCVWCNHEFKSKPRYIKGESDSIQGYKGKKGSVSDQIKCPNCLNFIPTWDKYKVDNKWIKKRL